MKGDRDVYQDAIESALARGWDDSAQEAYDRGWIHDYALDDIKGRNPYRGEVSE